MELSDYASALGAAQRLVPSYDGQRMNRLQMQGQELQNRHNQQQIAQVDAEAQERSAFQSAFVDLGTNPSAEKIRMLGVRFPTLSKGLNDAVAGMEKGQRQQVVADTAQIHAALNANRPDLAKTLVQRHINADKAAGKEPDPEDTALISMIDSGDKDQMSAAKGMLYATLAAADPDSAAKTIGEYGKGAGEKRYVVGRALVDNEGNALYRDPEPVQYKSVGANETLLEVGGNTGGGGQASSGNVAPDTLFNAVIAQESGGRAGVTGPQTAYGRAQGMTQMLPGTAQAMASKLNLPWQPQMMTDTSPAGAEYQRTLGRAYFDEGLKKYGGDPRKALMYYHGGPDESLWGPKTRAYAAQVLRKAGVAPDQGPVVSGGARVVAQGAPKPGYRLMTPAENQANGLDPNTKYQIGPEGQMTPLGGPKPKDGASADTTYSQSALDAFDRAIGSGQRLLKHPGFSASVGVKGLSGGLIGGWVVPGTSAADFNAELEAMKAQVFLPMVQSMKGMGALSDSEGKKLTAAIGALSTTMSEGGFKASMNRVISDLQAYRARGAPKTAKAPPAVGAVVRGYRFNGGNPASPASWSRVK